MTFWLLSLDHVICSHVKSQQTFDSFLSHHIHYVCLFVICRFSQVEQKRCTHQKRVLCGNWLTQCHLTPILARVYWLRSRTHFHSACTECISNVLWRREFGWSSFVFSNHAFFFARKSCGRRKKACACKVLL